MTDAQRAEIAKLEALHAEHPQGRIFTHLAEAYRKAGELERARTVLDEGIDRHPEYSSAHVVMARVYMDMGQQRDAEAEFRRVLELDAHNMVALRSLGDLARADGRTEEAADYYERLLDVEPADEEIRALVDRLRQPAGTATDEADAMDTGTSEDGELPTNEPATDPGVNTETIAQVYARQGLYDLAAEVYRQLLRTRPDDTELQARLTEMEALAEAPTPGTDPGPAAAPADADLEREEQEDAAAFEPADVEPVEGFTVPDYEAGAAVEPLPDLEGDGSDFRIGMDDEPGPTSEDDDVEPLAGLESDAGGAAEDESPWEPWSDTPAAEELPASGFPEGESAPDDAGIPIAGGWDQPGADAGEQDVGALDAGTLDAEALDVGALDAEALDAEALDTEDLDLEAGEVEAEEAGAEFEPMQFEMAEADTMDAEPPETEAVESVWTGAGGAPEDAATPYAWAESEEPEADASEPVAEYLRSLLDWRVGQEPESDADASETMAAEQAGAMDEASAGDGGFALAVEESRPEAEEPEGAAREPGWSLEEQPAPAADAASAEEPDVTRSAPDPVDPGSGFVETGGEEDPEGEDDDLEMFRAWLESLKQ